MTQLPSAARAVIVGGGVIGCSVAYHLAKLGWRDVILLERKQLTSGTTWHAAGLIAQLRQTHNMTRLARYSQELYGELEAETGVATGFKRVGSITVALTAERMEELRRGASMARAFGVEIEECGLDEIARRYDRLNLEDVVGGVYLPKDGQGDPGNIALALARGAQRLGVRIVEHAKVTAILTETPARQRRACGVTVEHEQQTSDIAADYVVNCAGMWGRELGLLAGVNVPLQACEHFYIVTEAIEGLGQLPVLRVPDECAYYKEDAGKMLLGAFEPRAKPWGMDGIPENFCFDQLPDDFDHFEPVLERAVNRMPMLASAGIRTFFNGPESFTPDSRYLLGEAPELDRFFVAAGFNSVGIQSAGGAGMALAQWMDAGEPPFDLWDVDIRRMHPLQNNRAYLIERSREALGLLYADHFPYRQYETARGIRRSALHAALAERGACFGEVAGFERPNWFLPPAARARGEEAGYRYSWQRQNWFEYAAAEHRAVREGVGLFDLSSFGKIRIEGADAEALLQYLCGGDVEVAPGTIVYTQFLNQRAGVEADITVTRLTETGFLVITPAATVQRDLAWLARHLPSGAQASIRDVTESEAVMLVTGPEARRVLQPLTTQSLANEDFPFGTAREIDLGFATVRAHRVSYAGELGWELYASADVASYVFEHIMGASVGPAVTLCGMHVLDSCRLEKAFRHFGHDITDEDHVLEAGLGFAVSVDKPRSKFGDFLGREAVLQKRQSGLERRLLQFKLHDPEPLLYHTEPIYRDGQLAGYLSSGGYGHHLGAAVGLGYVPCAPGEPARSLLDARFEIEVAGVRVAADASLRPMYDPKGERMRT